MAIEDAAALANALWRANLQGAMFNTHTVESIVSQVVLKRLAVTRKICRQSEFLTRLQCNDGVWLSLIGRYIFPLLHDIPASSAVVFGGTQKLDFVGIPRRSAAYRSGSTNWTLTESLKMLFAATCAIVSAFIRVLFKLCIF